MHHTPGSNFVALWPVKQKVTVPGHRKPFSTTVYLVVAVFLDRCGRKGLAFVRDTESDCKVFCFRIGERGGWGRKFLDSLIKTPDFTTHLVIEERRHRAVEERRLARRSRRHLRAIEARKRGGSRARRNASAAG